MGSARTNKHKELGRGRQDPWYGSAHILNQKLLKGRIRDGDVVKLRVSGEIPEIVENHAPESNVACPES